MRLLASSLRRLASWSTGVLVDWCVPVLVRLGPIDIDGAEAALPAGGFGRDGPWRATLLRRGVAVPRSRPSRDAIAKTSARKTLAKAGGKLGALGWQLRVRKTQINVISIRALKPANGCRSRWVAPDAARALLPLLSLAAHAVAHAAAQRSTRARTRTPKQTREYIDSATTPRL